MKKRILIFHLWLLFGLTSVLSAQEDNWYMDLPIVDIRFENLNRVGENELRSLVRDYIGQKYSDSLSWEIMDILFSLDYFDMVETELRQGDTEGNTVVLVYVVDEKPYIEDVRFVGNQRVRRNELLGVVLQKANDLIDNSLLTADRAAVESLYREKGFIDVQVEVVKEVSPDGESVNVYFEINEGMQTKIQEITFIGNDSVDSKVLMDLMETKVNSFFNKGFYSESLFQDDIIAITNYYKERGYIDADIINVEKNIVMDEEDALKYLNISVQIFEGEVYTLDEIQFVGASLYSDEEFFEKIYLIEGEPVDLIKFERNFYAITDMYHENGYIFNHFDYEMIRNDDERSVSFIVTILERERAHIENIIIKGNDKTMEYVLRREIPIESGDVYSKAKLQEAVMNLFNTGFFESIVPTPYQGSEDLLMDLELNVTEGRTADILFGLTFSGGPGFPVSGQLKWTDRNFLGSGKNVGVESTFSFDRQGLSLKYSDPWLFGVRWNGNFDLSYNHAINSYINQDIDGNGIPDPFLTWDAYVDENGKVPNEYQMKYESHSVSAGFGTGYTWLYPFARVGISGSMSSGFKYIDYDQDIFRPYNEKLIDNYHTWQYYDSIGVKLSWDNRKPIMNPMAGYIVSQSMDLGGIFNVSINEYMRSVSRFGFYHTLLDINYAEGKNFTAVLDFNTAFSYLFEKPWKSHHLALDDIGFTVDGMFIGMGWSTVTGGKALWDSSLTIKIPVAKNVLAFDIFLEGIGLWSSDEELDEMHLADFRFSAGTGFRFDNPSFPIGVYWVKKFQFNENYGINWNPEPERTEFKDLGMDLVVAFAIDMY